MTLVFFCQAEDGIRDLVRSRGLGDVYKRQVLFLSALLVPSPAPAATAPSPSEFLKLSVGADRTCLLYTSDAADERSSVDLGGRRIIKNKKRQTTVESQRVSQTTLYNSIHREQT